METKKNKTATQSNNLSNYELLADLFIYPQDESYKKKIKNIYDYTDALSRFKPGDETVLIVKRGEEELTLNVAFKK